MAGPDETTAAKRQLRERGWYVRYTEWPSGHQVVLHRRSDTAVHLVTGWWPTEAQAFEEALSLAAQSEARSEGRPSPNGSQPGAGPARARDLDVVVLGNAHEELIMRATRLPASGETLEADVFVEEPGGKGARQAIAAARLGARVALVARVGADRHGEEIARRLRAEHVATEHVARDPEVQTGMALVHLDRRGRRIGAVLADPSRGRLALGDIRAAEDVIRRASVVVASLDVSTPCLAEAFRIARRHGAHVVLDAAPARKISDRLLGQVDVAILDAQDAAVLTGASVTRRRSALNAARSLLRRGARAVALRGLGTTLVLTGADEIWIPNPPTRTTETVEARDAFCSALAVALAEQVDLARASELASAAAALAGARSGGSPALPTRTEVTTFASELPRANELVLDDVLPAEADTDRESPPHPPA